MEQLVSSAKSNSSNGSLKTPASISSLAISNLWALERMGFNSFQIMLLSWNHLGLPETMFRLLTDLIGAVKQGRFKGTFSSLLIRSLNGCLRLHFARAR